PTPAKYACTACYWDPSPAGTPARRGPTRFRAGYEIHSLAFFPNGKKIVSSDGYATVDIWDSATGQRVDRWILSHRREKVPAEVNTLAVSRDGKLLVAAEVGFIHICDALRGKPLTPPIEEPKTRFGSPAISPDSKLLAAGCTDGSVRFWELPGGQEVRRLKGHPGWATTVAFSPDGKVLAASGPFSDHSVRLWDVASGKKRHVLSGHKNWVQRLAFSPDGRRLATDGRGAEIDEYPIRIWEVATGKK